MAKPLQPDMYIDGGSLIEVIRNLASLNEVVTALWSGYALGEKPDTQYVKLVSDTLRDHSWRLGFEFNGSRPSADDIERLSL